MRLGGRALLLTAVATGALLGAAAPARATEFVSNRSFETSTTGWTGYQASLTRVAGGYDGAWSGKGTWASGSYFSVIASPKPVTNTMAGVTYTASAWIRSDRPKKTCLTMREYASTTVVQKLETCITSSTGWLKIGPLALVAQGTAHAIDLYVHEPVAASGDSFQLDAVSLTDNSAPADTTPPDTTITAGPSGTVTSTSASFSFTSTESGSTFACSLDGAAYAACTSPKSYSGLALGSHTFGVRATDAAGNVDPTPASRTWTISSPPDTRIDSGPATGPDTSATFTFSSTAAPATFECALDGSAFASCTSPKSYTGLAVGSHTFSVRSIDSAGLVDPSPATLTWSVTAPATPPDTTITSGPPASTTSTSATFTFTSTASPATFECALDGAAFASCTSPATYSGLAAAAHSFSVRSIDSGGLADPSPATWSWQVVPQPLPETTLTSQPAAIVATGVVTFAFSSPDAGASFECSLDGAAYAACTSPATVEVSNASHTFAVRAVNSAGADATPAVSTWWSDAILANGTFETSLTGWPSTFEIAGWRGYQSTLSRATDGLHGSGAGRAAYSSGGSYSMYASPRPVDAAVAGRVYTLNGSVRSDTPGKTVCLRVREYGTGSAASNVVGSGQKCVVATTAWQSFPALAYTALGGGQLDVDVYQSTAAAAGDSFEVDDVSVDDGSGRTTPPAASGDPNLIAVGDITSCYMSGDDWTARLVDGISGDVQSVGDNAYDHGTAGELAGCFGAAWGRHKDRYHPSLGDHEYDTGTADAYFDYFGAAAGPRDKGYYSYDVGAWHVVVTNTGNCAAVGGCGAGSAQEQWLRADLAAHANACTVAVVGEPRFSSGTVHGSAVDMTPLWKALYDNGADLVLSGDDHIYERFGPQDPDGNADPAYGIREFIVGTGGYSHYGIGTPVANSEARNNDTYGVLKLTLHANGYDWQFVPQSGRSFTDTGSGTCHAAPARDTTPPTVALTAPADGAFVAGTTTITADASDDRAVAKVDFTVNGTLVASDTTAPYSASWTTTSVADGSATIVATATDAAGNSSSSTRVVTVDNSAPDTSIDSGPSGTVTSTSATFTFSSPETGATFQCLLDSGAWTACTSPATYSGLASGSHTFSVRAVDRAGNLDASPASRTWTIGGADTTPPDTTITSGPPASTSDTSATFQFSSTEAGSTFQCALDAGAWAACTTPQTYSGLAVGSHTFQVRATDAAGNTDPTPASASWTITSPPPPPPPAPTNLIANGGFESGLGGWYGYQSTLSLIAGTVGANAAHVALTGSATSYSIITSPAPINPTTAGVTYTASAWFRAAAGKNVCLRIRELTWTGTFVGAAVTCVKGTGAWAQIPAKSYATLGSGNKLEVYAYQDAAVAGDTFDLDEVVLTRQ